MTIAEQIAAALGNDGQQWETRDGIAFATLMHEQDANATWRDGWMVGDVVRYEFRDGSVITEAGDAWDIGYPDCFCWQGAGHSDDCWALTVDLYEDNAGGLHAVISERVYSGLEYLNCGFAMFAEIAIGKIIGDIPEPTGEITADELRSTPQINHVATYRRDSSLEMVGRPGVAARRFLAIRGES